MVHAKACYLDRKRFTKRGKRPILSSTLVFQKKILLKKTLHTLLWMRMMRLKSLTMTLNLNHVLCIQFLTIQFHLLLICLGYHLTTYNYCTSSISRVFI